MTDSPAKSLGAEATKVDSLNMPEDSNDASKPVVNMSRQEMLIDNYWNDITLFSFDRAKEGAESEKELTLKTDGEQLCSSWAILCTAMGQIAIAEKAYFHFTFKAPKKFLWKDGQLKTSFETIRHDVKKIADGSTLSHKRRESQKTNSFIASILHLFVSFRLTMIDLYEKLSLLGCAKNVEIIDMISDLEISYEKFLSEKSRIEKIGMSAQCFKHMYQLIRWESEILLNLMKAHEMIQSWNYLLATIALQEANNVLQEWSNHFQIYSQSVKKSSFYKSHPQPALFTWLQKLKNSLLSKYTLYFYEILFKKGSSEVRNYSSKLSVDLFSKISNFQKKNDPCYVCLIFDARDSEFFYHDGYCCPWRQLNSPKGLDSFPTILACPSKPASYWPSVVMILSDKMNELSSGKVVGFYDKCTQTTFFLQKIDSKMFMLVLYESRKSEKDSNTQKFITEIFNEIKCQKIFSGLKGHK